MEDKYQFAIYNLMDEAVRLERRIKSSNAFHAKYDKLINRAIRIALFVVMLGIVVFTIFTIDAHAETGMASYYSVKSCHAESGQSVMANGKGLDDKNLTCASWRYPLGSFVRVCCGENSVICKVTDRGPGRRDGTSRFYKGTRIIDLTVAAFSSLAPLSKGVIKVTVKAI